MRYCSGLLTWAAILAYILALIAFGYILYDKAKTLETEASYSVDNSSSSSNQTSSVNTLKIIAYVLWAIAGISVLLVLCLYTKIKLAIAIVKVHKKNAKIYFFIQTASLFMKDCPLAILVPLFIFLVVVGWLAYWISAALYNLILIPFFILL